MELKRSEIMPGVWLSTLQTDKFKTACLSLSLLSQLRRETASAYALIPSVLRRGTARYPDLDALAARMDELYGTAVEPVVRRIGEIQTVGFFASIPESAFLPGGEDVLRPACELLGQLLLSPNTRGGLLRPQYVDSEKQKQLERIRSRINFKGSYSVQRCIEEMCCFEDFAVGRLGSEEDTESINYKKLTKQYHTLLQTSPVEIFYCGRAGEDELVPILRDALMTLPRGEIDYEIGTDVRLNAIEAQPRSFEEKMAVSQGKLVMGWRLGEAMEEPDVPALMVFNAVLGGSSTSKLFLNVREKKGLCYSVSSMTDLHKGLLLAAAGIDFDKFEETRDEIFRQLACMAQGEISDEELAAARTGVASDLRMTMDSQGELEGFYLAQALDGTDCGPLELAALAESVTKEQLAAIASGAECDMIYFLRGKDEEDEDDDEEIELSDEEIDALLAGEEEEHAE